MGNKPATNVVFVWHLSGERNDCCGRKRHHPQGFPLGFSKYFHVCTLKFMFKIVSLVNYWYIQNTQIFAQTYDNRSVSILNTEIDKYLSCSITYEF